MPIIKTEHLKYRYPNTEKLALNDISIEIEKGEFIGIAGRNGAGKSTLGQAIIGLVPRFYNGAYGGRVEVKGICVEDTPVEEMCENVGLIFQNPFNQLSGAAETVFNEVAYGLQNLGTDPAVIRERVQKVLKRLDIWEFRDRNPFELSGGQMQRVAIASILCMEPDIIILDEPTSQLDPQGTEEVFKVVDDLTDTGITIIMIEQKLEKMASYCDRIILMDEGRVVDFDTPEKIFAREDIAGKLFRADELKPEKRNPGNVPEIREEIFRVENLDFYYTEGTDIFQKLNLTLDNRPTAIIGQNGAGKTTLVRLLKGLLKPVGGRISFRGEDISKKTVAALADKVGYVFQNPDDQIFKYKVLDETMFGPLNIGMGEDRAREESLKALELMGLKGREDVNPYDLELYERKMTAIASVVAMDTDVIILDEPTIAQDYEGRKLIGGMIRELSSRGKLVIAILHDMDFVEEYFERVIVMAHGRILSEGSAEKVFSEEEILKEARLQKPYRKSIRELLRK